MNPETRVWQGRLGLFLILTFALSWGFDLAIALTTGHAAFLDLGLAPCRMLPCRLPSRWR